MTDTLPRTTGADDAPETPSERWLELYRWMLWSRLLEAECGRRNPRWFPVEGEEATVVGSFCDLRPDDVAAPHYRGPFVVYAMRGAEPWRLAAQALGKAAGYSAGRSVPFSGPLGANIVPWVAGDLGTTLGVATGAGLAFAYEGSERVCVVSFGDGTANRGDFHENVNLAACWRLPVVYVCQNNGWAISEAAESYLNAPIVARAAGYGIPGEAVDGNDVLAVRATVGRAVARARRGEGPSLIEARTYRLQGHWAADRSPYRSPTAADPWRERDPLTGFARRIVERGLADQAALARIGREVEAEVREAFWRAEQGPDPGPAELGLDASLESVSRPTLNCHSERSEESHADQREILRSAQNDKGGADATSDRTYVEEAVVRQDPSLGPSPAPRLTFAEALVGAIAREMRADPDVFMIGQDVGPFGGAMQGARALHDEFGPRRIRDAPISESAMVGAAIGAALRGKRPIVEISFGEFLPCAMSQIVLQAANLNYMTGGEARVPVTIRTRVGDGPYRGHPQSYEAWFAHVPGLKVVMPATPADARGLMASAIRDDGPVMVFEQMFLYHAIRDVVPDGEHLVPIGPARVAREGRDATIVATAWMVHRSLEAARTLAEEGIDVEIVDLRTLAPWDRETVLTSVRKTGRLVVAHEAWKVGGFGAEVAATVAERAFAALRAPIARVGAPAIPVPSATALRNLTIPTADAIADAVRAIVHGEEARP